MGSLDGCQVGTFLGVLVVGTPVGRSEEAADGLTTAVAFELGLSGLKGALAGDGDVDDELIGESVGRFDRTDDGFGVCGFAAGDSVAYMIWTGKGVEEGERFGESVVG